MVYFVFKLQIKCLTVVVGLAHFHSSFIPFCLYNSAKGKVCCARKNKVLQIQHELLRSRKNCLAENGCVKILFYFCTQNDTFL